MKYISMIKNPEMREAIRKAFLDDGYTDETSEGAKYYVIGFYSGAIHGVKEHEKNIEAVLKRMGTRK